MRFSRSKPTYYRQRSGVYVFTLVVAMSGALWHVQYSIHRLEGEDRNEEVANDANHLRATDHKRKSHVASSLPEGKVVEESECNIYMAPSGIPNAGMGMFTVNTILKGNDVSPCDSPGVGLMDPYFVNQPQLQLYVDKSWGETNGMYDAMRFEASHVLEVGFNFGALPNYHPYLHNMELSKPAVDYDDSLLNRTIDPGAGAFSYYRGKQMTARRNIKAGEELYINYGEQYLDYRKDLDFVAREKDYKTAGNMLSKFEKELVLIQSSNTDSDPVAKIKTLLSHLQSAASFVGEHDRVASILPKTPSELENVLAEAESFKPHDLSYAVARRISTYHRSIDWIKDNGMCLDNIIPGPSVVKQAGLGAIARHSLPKGEIIIPFPLLHIGDKDALGTYSVRSDKNGRLIMDKSKLSGKQLFLNYCFGHSESSLLLCPETNGVLINHCSKRKGECGTGGPNAEYRWASGWDNTQEWLKKSVDDIEKETLSRILSMEIVATRNIQRGEEIFIDYGPEWEAAWEDHVSKWKPPATGSGFESHTSLTFLNGNKSATTVPLEQTSDIRDDLSPEGNVITGCWYWEDDSVEIPEKDINWKDLDDDEILSRFSTEGRYFNNYRNSDFGHFWPCSVIAEENEKGSTYTVRIFQSKTHGITEWMKKKVPRFLTKFPRKSIRYFTKPYKSDQHLPGAFRHHIEIRDDIFPVQWKNRIVDEIKGGDFDVGDRIKANWENKGQWWNGNIAQVAGRNSFAVTYDENAGGGYDAGLKRSQIRKSSNNFIRLDLDHFYS